MRLIAVIALTGALAVAPAAASAKQIAPPGNPGVGQYLETVPTAHGNRPTDTVHPPTSTGTGSLPPATGRTLNADGPTGRATAALARATAPARPSGAHARGAGRAGAAPASGRTAATRSVLAATAHRDAPGTSLTAAVTGGGFGSTLLIVLGGTLGVGALLALVRRRLG